MPRLFNRFWKRLRFRSKTAALPPESVRRNPGSAGGGRAGCQMSVGARFFVVLALALVFYFIAGNTGSGWIYLICAALLSAILLGVALPLAQVQAVDAAQAAASQFVAGQEAVVLLKLRPSAPPLLPVRWLRLSYQFPPGRAAGRQGDFVAIRVVEQECSLRWSTGPLPRGVHRLGTVALSSSFPFGLAWWERRITAGSGQTITVYPKTPRIDGFFLFKLQPNIATSGGLSRGRQSVRQSTYTRGVREYSRGDSPRIVHWHSTARTGRLLVREFEAEGLPAFDVLLDLSARWQSQGQFELAVTAASALLALGHRLGIAPQLLLEPSLEELKLELPPVPPGVESQMEILARVNPVLAPASSAPEIGGPRDDGCLLVIQPAGSPRQGAENRYFIEIGSRPAGPRQPAGSWPYAHKEADALASVVANEDDIADL